MGIALTHYALRILRAEPNTHGEHNKLGRSTIRFPGNGEHTRLLTPMDRFCLHIICASILLLVTAFALGTPGLKSEGPPEKALLLRVAAR